MTRRFLAAIAAWCALGALPATAAEPVLQGPPTFYAWVAPLDFDGAAFSVSKAFKSCDAPWSATPYVAQSGPKPALNAPLRMAPACASTPKACESPALYVVARPVFQSGASADLNYAPQESFPAYAIAGPASPSVSPWTFAPIRNAAVQPASKYVFFVACIVAV